MRYSRWHSAKGRYEVFEGPDVVGINDDLPIPRMPAATKLGVPSVEAGRPLPATATPIGWSERAEGLITPSLRTGLGEAEGFFSSTWAWLGVGVLLGAGVTWWVKR